ncbi:MAG: leucine-rich repeat protein, partial [Lachnospiraceae bacterium]|nr:leucine-rich repeat protein [Lachnospiraceae bacterium]
MSKSKRKLSRKFKRTVGISLAVFFLIAAVVVALLPQKETSAYTSTATVYLKDADNPIPKIQSTDTIYTTGDGLFQFAYLNKSGGADKVAVICGYDYERSLPGGDLTIPDTVDAYIKKEYSSGSGYGYVAVSMSNEALYYPSYIDQEDYEFVLDENGMKIPILDADGNITYETDDAGQPLLDGSGNPIQAFEKRLTTIKVFDQYLPCYYNTIDTWKYNENGQPRGEDEYYYEESPGVFKASTDDAHKRMRSALVSYIANQNATPSATGWDIEDYDTAKGGIFSKGKNIVNLYFGKDLIGIGNHAFEGCANLSSVTFGDGINTIGNYAFASCYNLTDVSIPSNAVIPIIGERAFYQCEGLKSFSIPVGLDSIGDSCFEGCISLEHCILSIPDKNMSLKEMGPNVFKDCASLEELEFPAKYNEDQDVAWYSGCTSLKHITIANPNMKMFDSTTFSFDDFKAQLPEEFYFEGVKDKELHKVATANSIAFKYLNEEVYEKVTQEDPSNDKTKVVFRVNNQNELIYFSMGEDVTIVNIPNKIGPYGITSIGSDSFANNCSLKKVTIPSNITEIQAGAFKGCHNLTDVIFSEPINVSSIGEGAFDTQITGPECKDGGPGTTASLTFTGAARKSSAPFEYAMNPDNNINNGSQPEAYITFYTGWPSNFTVKYNPTTGENELTDVPTRSNINTSDFKDRAYMSLENQSAAASVYNLINSDSVPDDSTPQNVKDFYYAVRKPVLPDGITSIKEGLFSGLDKEGNPAAGMSVNNDIFSIEMSGVKKIDPYTFKDCDELANVKIHGDCTSLGDYAFEDCDNLASVVIDSDLSEFGRVPFVSSENLSHVDFGNNPNFVCKDSIIYSTVNGAYDSVLEVLASKTGGIIFDGELASVSSVKEEAFRDCDEIKSVDFTPCNVTIIPERCFEDTDKLYEVKLNRKNKYIRDNAFKDSGLGKISIPNTTQIAPNAFDGVSGADFVVEKGSNADDFAQNNKGIVGNIIYVLPTYTVVFNYMTDPGDESTMQSVEFDFVEEGSDATKLFDIDTVPIPADWVFVGWDRESELQNVKKNINTNAKYSKVDEVYWTLTFIDSYYNEGENGYIFYTDTVKNGEDYDAANGINRVQQPDHMKEGREFKGWKGEKGYTNVTENRSFFAQYEIFDPKATFTVTFVDWDDKVLYTQKVKAGEDCIEPKDPKREGYTFTGWRPSIKNITKDTTVYAQYEKNEDKKNPDNPDNKPDDNGNNGENGNNGDNGNNN